MGQGKQIVKRIDAQGHAQHAIARVRKHHAVQKGPANPNDPASVAEHQKELRDADMDIVHAKLSINDDDPDGRQE
jgi:hypothetical protein